MLYNRVKETFTKTLLEEEIEKVRQVKVAAESDIGRLGADHKKLSAELRSRKSELSGVIDQSEASVLRLRDKIGVLEREVKRVKDEAGQYRELHLAAEDACKSLLKELNGHKMLRERLKSDIERLQRQIQDGRLNFLKPKGGT